MADVNILYKGESIATMDASGTKTLNTQGKYCEDDISVQYVKPAGQPVACQILEFTLATHSSQNVTIGALSDEAYSHIDDDNFCVAMINTTPEQVVNFDDYLLTISNNPNQPKSSDTTSVFGIGFRLVSASIRVQALWCYYPANETNNSTSKGGIGKIWHNGKTLYYKSNGYYLAAGTYRVVITW